MDINKNITVIGRINQGSEVVFVEDGKKNEVLDSTEVVGVRDRAGTISYDDKKVHAALEELGVRVPVGTNVNPLRSAITHLRKAEKAAEEGNLKALQDNINQARSFAARTGSLQKGVLNERKILDLQIKGLKAYARGLNGVEKEKIDTAITQLEVERCNLMNGEVYKKSSEEKIEELISKIENLFKNKNDQEVLWEAEPELEINFKEFSGNGGKLKRVKELNFDKKVQQLMKEFKEVNFYNVMKEEPKFKKDFSIKLERPQKK